VQASRQRRIELAVSTLYASMSPALNAASKAMQAARQATERHEVVLDRRRRFRAAAEKRIEEALEQFRQQARRAGETVAKSLSAGEVWRDGRYERRLNAELRKEAPGAALCDDLDEALARHDLPPLPYATRCAILADLRVPTVSLSVADLPLNKSLIGKAAVGGGGLSGWLGPGVVVGLLGGGVAGYAMAKRAKAECDVAQTRESVGSGGHRRAACRRDGDPGHGDGWSWGRTDGATHRSRSRPQAEGRGRKATPDSAAI
jgi:hypothetical protein